MISSTPYKITGPSGLPGNAPSDDQVSTDILRRIEDSNRFLIFRERERERERDVSVDRVIVLVVLFLFMTTFYLDTSSIILSYCHLLL